MTTPFDPQTDPSSIPTLGPSRRHKRTGSKYLGRRVALIGAFCLVTATVGGGFGMIARAVFGGHGAGAGDRQTVLVATLDASGRAADSLTLFSLDRKAHRGFVLSIPRSTQGLLANGRQGALGDSLAQGGPAALQAMTSAVTGFSVDHTIRLDAKAAKALIGELGSVSLPLSRPLTWSDARPAFKLPAGVHHLTPEQALVYAGHRSPLHELERIKRQQFLINAWHGHARGLMGGWWLPGYAKRVSAHVKTDMPAGALAEVLSEWRSLAPTDVAYATLPGDEDGARYIVSPQRQEALEAKLTTRLADDKEIAASRPTLEILYDEAGDQQVMALASRLTDQGFSVIRTSRAPIDGSETRLIDRAKAKDRSHRIVTALDSAAKGLRWEVAGDALNPYGAEYTLELGKPFFR